MLHLMLVMSNEMSKIFPEKDQNIVNVVEFLNMARYEKNWIGIFVKGCFFIL